MKARVASSDPQIENTTSEPSSLYEPLATYEPSTTAVTTTTLIINNIQEQLNKITKEESDQQLEVENKSLPNAVCQNLSTQSIQINKSY